MSMVKIVQTKEELEQVINLRYKILRQPWSQPYETSSDDLESTSINAYLEENSRVLACGRLQDNGGGVGQVRYMAVDAACQGKGYGYQILNVLESKAKAMGLHTIELQARENAVPFYLKNGYTIKEKTFKLWDIIQHYLMFKKI